MYQLPLHEARANASRKLLFSDQLLPLNLVEAIHIPDDMCGGQVKCRVIYDREIRSIAFQPYQIREIKVVKVVYDDQISYPHKWEQREALDELFARRGQADEILIFKDGWLTDAYYYNVVICVNGRYITPRLPLLSGIRRTQLLDNSWITEADIDLCLLRQASAIYLVNAMTPLGKIKLAEAQVEF